ncbi:hypothetical protein CMV_000583 [Castanea mollissima]|uniref:Uncharacterized protein n=1 Tax=Castanea mollissima TaxID=60419 RepID=A0A8J4VYY1_9ROSI|nr:hypothetical protein CMV_000583 [Castanea mollissima]
MGAFCVELLVRRRLPGFSPARVLGFGDGTGSAFWALQVMWPKSLEKVKLDVPSQTMQHAGWSLIQVLHAWRDTITEGQNHYTMPTLGSFTGCSGMIPAYGNFLVSSCLYMA